MEDNFIQKKGDKCCSSSFYDTQFVLSKKEDRVELERRMKNVFVILLNKEDLLIGVCAPNWYKTEFGQNSTGVFQIYF